MTFIKHIFSSRPEQEQNFYAVIKKILGFKPHKIDWFVEAFTHRSTQAVNSDGQPQNYERLEFVGDAMLGSVIASHLFRMVPAGNEGYLTKMRSKVVSREHLNELGRDLDLIALIRTNVPIDQFGENIHGNLFEALVGAIYLDRGYHWVEKFIQQRVIEPYVDIEKLEGKVISYKSLMIEWCQKHKKIFKFQTYEDSGVETIKHFAVKLLVDKVVVGKARGTSKKKAEELAAKRAYYKLQGDMDAKKGTI
ncbi:MAG: ribonuclease III [Flavobacteriaceae bacterium]|jgi:ribonuclease III|nr:ribonuclease III [Flavobacteriaceae bacterium]MDG1062829.1 ribonuclease III [Flavobacteriaceae bacterium]MDG1961567.1 ribonuclease III [Flavobacteriaceae bacterium]